ncbi:conserved oligomeric Golgi complex subunit 2 [Neodiprion fabricii]|uniref:conserved oligomeric Golgi complex subunit 2 n=1 Tax=Neodiprion fabricii TaxID=2872261 RepID=UPI001ED9425E|nr:conserved oligomeric Golgi complex subunit 2 [Neodiprion fabricii]
MPETSEDFMLPKAPKDLSFNENDFNANNFNVDAFLQEHRKKASLETMRDDLGVYLKVLRSAMIELINKDYADFVNLSSNLIGLDKAINNLQVPLGQLREEVMQVRQTLDDMINEVTSTLNERCLIRERKQSLQSLAHVHDSITKLSNILVKKNTSNSKDKEQIKLDSDLLERAATEFNQLKFHISRCKTDLTEARIKTCNEIGQSLMSNLDKMFISSIKKKQPELLIRCLRIYVTLDKVSDTENLLRRKLIAPLIENVINEITLQSEPQGLRGIYQRLLSIFDEDLAQLLTITLYPDRMSVKGFNFIVNSFWPEVEERIELHLNLIFAPGNPELFHRRYLETVEFLTKLEEACCTPETLSELKGHALYHRFLGKWNLPVYFQIRFQEIAGTVEAVLCEDISPSMLKENTSAITSNEFTLHPTNVVWESLMKTWADGIFLPKLLQRFWKLSLQIISRYQTWCKVAVTQSWPDAAKSTTSNIIETAHPPRLQFLVFLYTDIEKLMKNMPSFLEVVWSKVTSTNSTLKKIFEDCSAESEKNLQSTLPLITDEIMKELMSQSAIHLKQVSDIPRLFRRTNREVPTKPCTYVSHVIEPLTNFYMEYNSAIPGLVTKLLESTVSLVSEQYLLSVTDVLTSVQKTEESLRRLKKIRDKSTGISSSEGKGIGDDEKIRIQLEIDVQNFYQMIGNLGIIGTNVSNLKQLLQVVQEALTSRNETR